MVVKNREVINWYEKKTGSILRKYGPGPSIHFHTGLVECFEKPSSDAETLRLQIVSSQEALLLEAYRFWKAEDNLRGIVLDVGCGLGGSSIFLAQRYGSHVHALTNVPRHIQIVASLASRAGVDDRVEPILGDACSIPGNNVYDAAIAVDSTCYLDREAWFSHLAQRIREGGHVCIADSFTESAEVRKPFNRYWLTRIGSAREYISEAAKSGFKLKGSLDLTSRTSRFWEFNITYSRLLLKATTEKREVKRLLRSIKWQTELLGMWNDREITYNLLHFKLTHVRHDPL